MHTYIHNINAYVQTYIYIYTVVYPGIFSVGGGGLKILVEDRGQKERGFGGVSPLVRGSIHFENE
jgi:hypothetical protein